MSCRLSAEALQGSWITYERHVGGLTGLPNDLLMRILVSFTVGTPIQQFYTKKSVFMTGATGFLGKGGYRSSCCYHNVKAISVCYVNRLEDSRQRVETRVSCANIWKSLPNHIRPAEVCEPQASHDVVRFSCQPLNLARRYHRAKISVAPRKENETR